LSRALIIACGALARELNWLKSANQWTEVEIQCLDAALHNRPELIPEHLSGLLERTVDDYDHIFVAYADCGTGGRIDQVLAPFGVSRLPGAHCYEFYAGSERFQALADKEPGTFYLTDFLVRHFDRLVIGDLKLDEHPELELMLFGAYKRMVYLAQTDKPELLALAHEAADRLSLPLEVVPTTLSGLESPIDIQVLQWREADKDATCNA
jgi:hypothetical protein